MLLWLCAGPLTLGSELFSRVSCAYMLCVCFVNVQTVGGDGEEHQKVVALEVVEVVVES